MRGHVHDADAPFSKNLRVPIGKVGYLHLTKIREGIFSAARLPLNNVLGNSWDKREAGNTTPAFFLRLLLTPSSYVWRVLAVPLGHLI